VCDALSHPKKLELDPGFGIAHVMMGRISVAKGMPDQAL